MSATYNNQIEIAIFENTSRKNDKAPVQRGSVTFPDGTKYDVALWDKVSKNGLPYRAGVLQLPDPKYTKGGGQGGQATVDF